MHLAIIPDGNRRWAKKRSLLPWNGHEQAIENFRSITDWCRDDGRIDVLTVWCFSTENWKRDEEEVSKLMKLLEDYLKNEKDGLLENNTRFCHSGRKDRIPESLREIIEITEEETKDCDRFVLNLAVDYGGKDEILRAIEKAGSDALNFEKYLDHPELPDIDLIVRTSGEHRTSNFFMWESTYTEWEFFEILFPDFNTEHLQEIVDTFSSRNRRYGS